MSQIAANLEISDVFAVLLQRVHNGRLEVVNCHKVRKERQNVLNLHTENLYIRNKAGHIDVAEIKSAPRPVFRIKIRVDPYSNRRLDPDPYSIYGS